MRSVRTTFRILEAVAEHQPVGLSDLALRLDIPKSTVQRSLTTLADLGWIHADGAERTRWELGDRVLKLSEGVDRSRRVRDAALPAIRRLNEETTETIHLAVPDGDSMTLIERELGQHALLYSRPVGTRSPLHATSTGKAFLAALPSAALDAVLAAGLPARTARTITDAGVLRAELVEIRSRGYAVCDQENYEGVVSIAAAIRPNGGRPIASMSISAPSFRVPPAVWSDLGQKIAEAAREVEQRLSES